MGAPVPRSSDGQARLGDNPAPMTFDEALAALVALVGERVTVHVMDAGQTPHLVATFGGRLQAGYSITGGEPSDTEAIFVRLNAGEETAAISLDREVFEDGIAHEDGAITLQLGGVEFVIARRE
jgi:hypothetical protein